jgi:hypothetical protein
MPDRCGARHGAELQTQNNNSLDFIGNEWPTGRRDPAGLLLPNTASISIPFDRMTRPSITPARAPIAARWKTSAVESTDMPGCPKTPGAYRRLDNAYRL